MDKRTHDILYKLYTSSNSSAAYTGATALLNAAKAVDKSITLNNVKQFLQGQDTHTLYSIPRKRIVHEKTIYYGIHDIWSADIGFLSKALKDCNENLSFLLVVDNFSLYTFVRFIRDRQPTTVTRAFKSIIEESLRLKKGIPSLLHTDDDTCFKGAFDAFLKTLKPSGTMYTRNTGIKPPAHVERYVTSQSTKAFMAESRIKFYKRIITKVAETANTWPALISHASRATKICNNRFSETINTSPAKVNENNEQEVFDHRYGKSLEKARPPVLGNKDAFVVGDEVRIAVQASNLNKKSANVQYTFKTYIITEIIDSIPIRYRVRESNGDLIRGSFYAEQLIHATNSGKRTIQEAYADSKDKKKATVYYRELSEPEEIDRTKVPKHFHL